MNAIQHYDGVFEIENFLTDKEIDALLTLTADEGWIKSHPGNIVKNIKGVASEVIPDITLRIQKMFNNAQSHTPITNIRRLQVDESMKIHKDSGDPKNPLPIVFGIAIYLNDDFAGGYLSYPDIELSIKPRKGSLVVHRADLNHRVLKVTSGSRYSITTFVFGNEDTNINL